MNENDEKLFFAPVIIPTLCRFEHLKSCVESLSQCIGAKHTDVYIGIDYPAKESHWDGYNKINKYLNECKLNFKSLVVLKRERNFGPNGNLSSLRQLVFEHYDRVIISEDDNVFSPNFLVYMNNGLEKFKDDDSVFAICGYKHLYPIKKESNTFFMQNVDFSAWGFGIWKNRWETLPPVKDYFRKIFSWSKILNIKHKVGSNRAIDFFCAVRGDYKYWFDTPISLYGYLENKNFVYPSNVSLVRNMGWDNSGEHCAGNPDLANKHLRQKISDDFEFEYIGSGFEFYKQNRSIIKKYTYAKISEFKFWGWLIKNILIFVLFGKK